MPTHYDDDHKAVRTFLWMYTNILLLTTTLVIAIVVFLFR